MPLHKFDNEHPPWYPGADLSGDIRSVTFPQCSRAGGAYQHDNATANGSPLRPDPFPARLGELDSNEDKTSEEHS